MAITLNTVTGHESHGAPGFERLLTAANTWVVIGQTSNATGNEELKAAETGKTHYLQKIRVDMCPGSTAASFTINAGSAAQIGPVDLIDTGSTSFEYEFIRALSFGSATAIHIDTEAADQIHVILEGYTM